MNTQEVLDPKSWAERTVGSVQLHDQRRTRRTVKAATNLAENPLGSLPAHMHTWKETKALYRLLDEPEVTFAALMQPHLQQTREQASRPPVVLLVQDTTDIDLSHRHKISGVGQIGNERGRGFFVQTVLAVCASTQDILGCMAQEPFVRIPALSVRTTLRAPQAARARNGCLDAPGVCHWPASSGKPVAACWGSRRRYVSFLSRLSSEPDPLSRPSGSKSACRAQ